MKHPPAPLATAICEAVVAQLAERLLAGIDPLQSIVQERRVNEAIVGQREVKSLAAAELVQYQQLIGQKTGKQIAAAIRLTHEAMSAPSGLRKWFGKVHTDACKLFNRVLEEYADGTDRDPLRLLAVQTVLIAVTHARGLLGLPIQGAAKRKYTAAREFEPADYPEQAVRDSIVLLAFGGDADGAATLRALSLNPAHDRDGRIMLLLAAHDGDDASAKDAFRRLAGRIMAAEPRRFIVRRPSASLPRPAAVAPATLFDRARDAAQGNG